MTRFARALCRRIGLTDAAAWRLFVGYYRPHTRSLLFYTAVSSAQSLTVLPVLSLIRYAFDVAIPTRNIWLLTGLGAGILGIRMLNGVVGLLTRARIVQIIKQVVRDVRHDLIAHVYTLSRDFHARSEAARVHTWIVHDTERVDQLGNALFSAMLPAAVSSVALLGCLLYLSWPMALVALVVAPAAWLTAGAAGRSVKRHVTAFQQAFEAFSRGIFFVLRHVDLTSIHGYEREETRRQTQVLDQLRITGTKMAMSFALHRQLQQNVVGLSGILLLVAGGVEVALGRLSVGEFLVFYLAASLLNGSVSTVIGAVPDVIAGNASLTKLRELRAAGPLRPYSGTRAIAFRGHIALRNVSFAYGAHPVLAAVNLEIRPGARIAIVGPNGAGKSTLLHLIMGVHRPLSGELLADGIPYDEVDMRSLRRRMGVVVQRAAVFQGTILENITYGRPDAGLEDIIAASRLAGAHEFISALPTGYETAVGERGLLLSGGECQRIAIARALLGRPQLLILDEPTTHLDSAAVDELLRRSLRREGGPAVIVVSHDRHVVDFADELFTLEDGVLTPTVRANAGGREHVSPVGA